MRTRFVRMTGPIQGSIIEKYLKELNKALTPENQNKKVLWCGVCPFLPDLARVYDKQEYCCMCNHLLHSYTFKEYAEKQKQRYENLIKNRNP